MGKTGIIYIMTTSVKGIIKIGKTDDFKKRMDHLEQNGYWNVCGLQRYYAVKVKDYDEKEKLIKKVFNKSQVANSELFALDVKTAKEMLESFDGKQIYPDPSSTSSVAPVASAVVPKADRLTFKMLNIPIGSTLVYVPDNSITCTTVDNNSTVIYKGKNYKLSGLVKYLKNGGSWQGGNFFMYNGKKLTDIRKDMGL